MINKPHVDWFALSPSLALLAAAGLLLMVAVFVPAGPRRAVAAFTGFAGFVAAFVFAIVLVDGRARTARPRSSHDSLFRDRWAALAQVLIAGCGVVAVLVSYGERMRDEHVAEYYALLAAAGAGMAFFVQASNLMTLFLGLEWFSIALYVLTRDRHRPDRLARGGPQVPDRRRRRLGDAALRLRARLRRDRPAVASTGSGLRADGTRLDARRRPRDDHRRAGVQGVGGAVPHVDAGRLPGRADPGDGVHGVGDEGRGARRHLPRARRSRSRRTSTSGAGRSP